MFGVSPADTVGQPDIDFARYPTPHVIGLEAGKRTHVILGE
jgi:hypothetical protein